MRMLLNQFLTSGHTFTRNDNLEKFRFSLLNVLMVINVFFTALGFISSLVGSVHYSLAFTVLLGLYLLFSVYLVFLLRKNVHYYAWVVTIFIFGMMSLFYSVLFMHTEDEFRLISFFFLLMSAFVLRGKQFGLIIAVMMMSSVYMIAHYYDLNLSQNGLRTFFSFMVAFSVFLYFFMNKIQKDSLEFKRLNKKLKKKVKHEVLQREEQEKLLLRQCRMANMGEMIDAIAHQWRQPLMSINAVLMNLDVIAEEKKELRPLKDGIDEIASLTSHMSQTIDDFRTLYQVEKQKSTFLLSTLIDEVMALMKNNLRDIKVEVEGNQNIKIYSYKSELTQVMITLLSNAIEVLHSREIIDKKIFMTYRQEEKMITMEIEDNAGGIVDSNVDKIFDPYFTTKKQIGGTGLGLYIAHIIIEHNMHGKMTVSNTHRGAKFVMTLPSCAVL